MLTTPPSALRSVPRFVRAEGGVRLVLASAGARTAAMTISESGGYRVRFPRAGGTCEGVLINTGGGMTGGDRMRVDVTLEPGAAAVLTSQAAEKIYRSDGDDTQVAIRLSLAERASLDWLPQEQILFDGSRLARTLDVALDREARLTLVESVFFGRAAFGESLRSAAFRDRWRVRREGRLVFAEDVRIDGPVAERLARPAIGGGARAAATVLHVAPDAEGRLEEARAALEGCASEAGASAWNGLLIVRLISPDAQALRADLARFLQAFRGRPLPRSWQT